MSYQIIFTKAGGWQAKVSYKNLRAWVHSPHDRHQLFISIGAAAAMLMSAQEPLGGTQ